MRLLCRDCCPWELTELIPTFNPLQHPQVATPTRIWPYVAQVPPRLSKSKDIKTRLASSRAQRPTLSRWLIWGLTRVTAAESTSSASLGTIGMR